MSARPRALALLLQVLLSLLLLRNIVTQQRAATRFDVTVRTVRNWISRGLITGYKLPGGRAIRVDLDEIEKVMSVVPATVARPGQKPFGPKAKIVDLSREPVRAVVVERDPALANLDLG